MRIPFGKLFHNGGQDILFFFRFRTGVIDFMLDPIQEFFVVVGAFIDDVDQSHNVAAALDGDSMARIDGMHQTGF